MNTVYNPDGTVTVHSPGDYSLSEIRSEAALRFAHEHGTAVDWPALVRTTELGADAFAATYALAGV